MPYKVEHEDWCKDKSRYLVTRMKIEVVDSEGVILDNSDPGWVMATRCACCSALVTGFKKTNISVGESTSKLSDIDNPVKCKNISE